MPVPVPRREVHQGICTQRIQPQQLFHTAQLLDKITPVRRPDDAQRTDAVANRYLVRSLLLIFLPDKIIAAAAGCGQLLLHPTQWQGKSRSLPLQLTRKTRNKSAA